MSNINRYHKDIYIDFLQNSHKWQQHIIHCCLYCAINEIEDSLDKNNIDYNGVIVTALYVPEDNVDIKLTLRGDTLNRSIYLDWRESSTTLEQLLEQARNPRSNIYTYYHRYDFDHSNGKVKRIQFEYPFIYLPKGVDLDLVIKDETGIYYMVECYAYTGEKIDIPFPYSDKRKYNISPDVDKLDNEINNELLSKDKDILKLESKLYHIDGHMRYNLCLT